MKLEILTIVLDGMPWISRIWPELEKLSLDWRWHVVEGVALGRNCTSWCASMAPRLSIDGTTQYLDSIAAYDHRVVLHRKEQWHGKIHMVNEPLRYIHEKGLLIEMDSDELWTAEQLTEVVEMFKSDPTKNCAHFRCDYRFGPKVRITSRETYGNDSRFEWKRAWRFSPGMRFKTHEPPSFEKFTERPFTHDETESRGLVFRHESYSTEKQVAFKEFYYGSGNNRVGHLYKGATAGWRSLQRNKNWPVNDLKQFIPWVGDNVIADKI